MQNCVEQPHEVTKVVIDRSLDKFVRRFDKFHAQFLSMYDAFS